MSSFQKYVRWIPLSLILSTVALPVSAEVRSLSQGWLFKAGETAGAQQAGFDDAGWRPVVVPHDFGVMDRADGTPPFDPAAIGGQDNGYLPGGIGWYRHRLTLAPADVTRVIRLRFEAVYMDAEIWLNGKQVGKHHYGYTAFSLDLTGQVRAGVNVIVVRVNHAAPSSRWYAGSGLIRPVALELLDPVHIAPDSAFVTTELATPERGALTARASVSNRSAKAQTVELVSTVLTTAGAQVARARQQLPVAASGKADFVQPLALVRPALWSPEAPHLHTLVQEVRIGGVLTDVRRIRFGIRTISVDSQNGLRINGKKLLLRGGNIHHDNYMIGAAGAPDADARKVALMKAAGYNAIRSAHNPASQATMDAADELGMLVIGEAFDMWQKKKNTNDYARFFATDWQRDIDSMVIAGRNHPSLLFWSVGNEIPEQGTPEGVATARKLVARIRQLDPTRAVTQGVNIDSPHNAGQFAEVDVAGYNYRAHLFDNDHKQFPARVMYTSESTSKEAFKYWRPVEAMPWVIGDFVWTAFDYLGETGIGWMGYSQDWKKLGAYPWHLAYCGEIDATGRKRPAAYYREVLWKTGIDPISAFVRQPKGTEALPDRFIFPIVQPHLDWSLDDVHPSWTWAGQEGRPLDVEVYSEFPEVELQLNGKSLGRKAVGVESEYKAKYTVNYAPGRLVALGYRDGKPAGQWELRTAGPAASVSAALDRQQFAANGEDLAYLTVALVDANGTPLYARDGDRHVKVTVAGAGTLAGIGNGNPMDAASFQSGERKSFHGRVVAAIRAATTPGPVMVEISADGLPVQRLRFDAVSR